MKRLLVTVLMLTLTAALWAWPEAKRIEVRPGSALGWDNASGTWRPFAVSGDGKIPIDGDFTMDASTTLILEDIRDGSLSANYIATQSLTIASTSQEITSNLPPGTPREFIEIVSESNTDEFWLNYGGPAAIADGTSRRVYGGIYIELRGGAGSVNVIASTTLKLYITEGGSQ